jgi:hypothetical protein
MAKKISAKNAIAPTLNNGLHQAMIRIVKSDQDLYNALGSGVPAKPLPADSSTAAILETLSKWPARQVPIPRELWFKIEDYRAYFKECMRCKALHYLTPREPALWSLHPFICVHCSVDTGGTMIASPDQGIFVGSAVVDGMVAYDWHVPCMICRVRFFRTCKDTRKVRKLPEDRKSTMRRIADQAKLEARNVLSEDVKLANPVRRRSRGMKPLFYVCERCDGSTRRWRHPDEFGTCSRVVRERSLTRLYDLAVKRVGLSKVDPDLVIYAGKIEVKPGSKLSKIFWKDESPRAKKAEKAAKTIRRRRKANENPGSSLDISSAAYRAATKKEGR